jgi:hypothetical protein
VIEPTDAKRCRVCGQEKPLEGFYAYSGRTCRACQAARARAWALAHRERHRANQRRSARRRRQDPKRLADLRLADRLWYLRNGQECRLRKRRAYWADPEKAREKTRRWKRRHPDHVREYQARYRERDRHV